MDAAAFKAVRTRKRVNAFTKARAAEAASKEALRSYCAGNGWRVAFFEGETGLGYHLKTGHTLSVQNRPTGLAEDVIVLPCRSVRLQG